MFFVYHSYGIEAKKTVENGFEPSNLILVKDFIEFKFCILFFCGVLEQIKGKKYDEKYREKYEEIYLIGVEFNAKERNVVLFEWEKL